MIIGPAGRPVLFFVPCRLEAIDDIKKLMHQSSRFISLSGWKEGPM
ncbi:hypothetical protein V9K67_12660 [Paraflavisolibacter sp. H34]